jgi:sugar transferase EpsL
MKPGITGLAQVKGRNLLSWEEKFRHDLIYLQRSSFFFDLVILWETFWLLFTFRDEPLPERLDDYRNLRVL